MQNYFKGYTIRAGVIGSIVAIAILLSALIPILGCFIGLIAWVVYLGTGILSAHWGKAAAPSRTLRQSAIEGVVAGGIAGSISHVAKFIAQVLFFLLLFRASLGGEPGRIGVLSIAGVECVTAAAGIVLAVILATTGAMAYTTIVQQQNKSTT